MKLRENIYQLSGAAFGQLGSAYAIQYGSEFVLIDTSHQDALETIKCSMKYWGINENKITHVLLTHGHDDHSGCASYFQELGAKIYVGAEDKDMLEWGNFGEESPCTNHFMPSFTPDYLIESDEKISIGNLEFNAIKVPGHTDGTTIYTLEIDEDFVLFSGDFFFPDGERGDQAQTGWKGDMSYSVEKLSKSFAKLWALKLKPTIVLGGHGIPLFGANAERSILLAYKFHMLNNR